MNKHNINVFKMLTVKCEEIWRFDIRMFSVKINQETVNFLHDVLYLRINRI